MKKICLWLLAGLCCLAGDAFAQEGTWSGKLQIGEQSLVLVFHFEAEGVTFDSPDQGVWGLAVERDSDVAPSISLHIPSIGAHYKGMWLGPQILGSLKQHGYSFPLTLKPGFETRRRPQTPVGPFPYRCEEISFVNGNARLKGTLTLPAACDDETPVLIMLTGSGLQNRDEEIFEHKPFAVLADAFARAGIATLRYDDRGFGESTGDLVQVTTADLKNDALAGIKLLRSRFKRVGVLGHSEGGTIALLLAAEQQVDFALSLAGMVISGKETLLEQNRLALTRAGFSDAIVGEYLQRLNTLFDRLIAGQPAQVDERPGLPEALNNNLRQVARVSDTPYMRHFLKLELPVEELQRIEVPVMALNGTMDQQVDCRRNLSVLRQGLRNARSRVEAFEGLNHLFQTCETGSVEEYKEIEETFSPDVIELMIRWVDELR